VQTWTGHKQRNEDSPPQHGELRRCRGQASAGKEVSENGLEIGRGLPVPRPYLWVLGDRPQGPTSRPGRRSAADPPLRQNHAEEELKG
jgi:hypothetical protein